MLINLGAYRKEAEFLRMIYQFQIQPLQKNNNNVALDLPFSERVFSMMSNPEIISSFL